MCSSFTFLRPPIDSGRKDASAAPRTPHSCAPARPFCWRCSRPIVVNLEMLSRRGTGRRARFLKRSAPLDRGTPWPSTAATSSEPPPQPALLAPPKLSPRRRRLLRTPCRCRASALKPFTWASVSMAPKTRPKRCSARSTAPPGRGCHSFSRPASTERAGSCCRRARGSSACPGRRASLQPTMLRSSSRAAPITFCFRASPSTAAARHCRRIAASSSSPTGAASRSAIAKCWARVAMELYSKESRVRSPPQRSPGR